MNRLTAIVVTTLVCIAVPALAGDLVKVANEPATPSASKRRMYVPPTNLPRLREKTRIQSGATRSARAPTELRVLAPEHTGLTVQAQPTLYWYTSRRVEVPVEFVIEAADGAFAPPLLDRRLSPPFEAGLHAVPLADLGISLEPGHEYAWRVIVVVDENRRSNDVYAGANIARVEETESLRSALSGAAQGDHPRIYASAGLWYDALASIDALRNDARDRGVMTAQCRDLLDGQSLQDVSCP